MTFSEKLKTWMKDHGETAVSLAKAANLDRSVVQRLATGDRLPNLDHYKALAPIMGTTVAALMEEAPLAPEEAGPAQEVVARFVRDFGHDLTPREKEMLDTFRDRLDKASRISEADIHALLGVIRSKYPPSRS